MHYVGMFGLEQHVDLTERGDRKALLLLFHLQLLQGNDLTCRDNRTTVMQVPFPDPA